MMSAAAIDVFTSNPEINGYKVISRLGQGGMSVVFLAEQISLQRQVAIKVMDPARSNTPELIARFENEARTIAALDHPCIVGIHEIGFTREGLPYYVMPLLLHGDLASRDYKNQAERIVGVIKAVCEALQFAHSKGIVHRDVKPENILFDKTDRPLLADFGIALSQNHSHRVTTDGTTLGSTGYMSPEQARGHPVDGRSDIYSLGIVVFEMLTGHLPYGGSDALAVAIAHMQDPVPRLPAQHANWQSFIDTAMAKKPASRFQNASEMLQAAEKIVLVKSKNSEVLKKSPSTSRPTVTTHISVSKLQRSFTLLTIALAAFTVAFGSFLIWNEVTFEKFEPATANSEIAANESEAAPADSTAIETELVSADAQNEQSIAAIVAAINAGNFKTAHSKLVAALVIIKSGDGQNILESLKPIQSLIEARMQSARKSLNIGGLAPLAEITTALKPYFPELHQQVSDLSARLSPRARLRDAGGPLLIFIPLASGKGGFAVSAYEVTRGEYAQFVKASNRVAGSCRSEYNPLDLLRNKNWINPGFEQSDTHPAVCVSAVDADAYADWISRRTGQRYKLPTRAQWQSAAIGINDLESPCEYGNILDSNSKMRFTRKREECTDGFVETSPIGKFKPSRSGVFDMLGNVSEWTSECADGECKSRYKIGISYRQNLTQEASNSETAGSNQGDPQTGIRLVREITAQSLPALAR